MITLTNKGFKMVNYRLATSNNVTLEQRSATNGCVQRGHSLWYQLVILLKQWDQKAQRFFAAQASTRAQEPLEIRWGFDLHSGF